MNPKEGLKRRVARTEMCGVVTEGGSCRLNGGFCLLNDLNRKAYPEFERCQADAMEQGGRPEEEYRASLLGEK